MKLKIIFAFVFMLAGISAESKNLQQKFEKSAFYAAMSSGSLDDVNAQLDIVTTSSSAIKDGYEGALLMRKADLVKRPAEKLKLFKAGRIKLETALLNNPDNVEYHFLRFAIEEHAPKIVKYHADLEADKQFIIKKYKDLSPVVQRAIMDYTKNSKLLHADDLQY